MIYLGVKRIDLLILECIQSSSLSVLYQFIDYLKSKERRYKIVSLVNIQNYNLFFVDKTGNFYETTLEKFGEKIHICRVCSNLLL